MCNKIFTRTICGIFCKPQGPFLLFCCKQINEKNVTGSFVVVDDSGGEEAVESGRKVACVVVQVLFHDQVRVLQKSPQWLVFTLLHLYFLITYDELMFVFY